MNKKIKYILGYGAILILAILCTYGLINYDMLKNKVQVNNSQNLGSVDGKQISKETTIIIKKLSTLNDLDALNSELKLSDAVLTELKQFSPTISYAVEKEGNEDKIIFKQGGYYNKFKFEKVDKIIGVYKVKDGKVENTGEKSEEATSKYKKTDLTWKNLDIKNTEHNKEVASKFAEITANILDGKSKDIDASLIISQFSDPQKHIKIDKMMLNHIPMKLTEIVDGYNALQSETVDTDYVMNKLKNSQYLTYREIDDNLTGNEEKYSKVLKEGELIFFKKDKMVLATYRGHGSIFLNGPSKPDMWKIEGDKITIPISTSVSDLSYKGKLVLRLNNKKYEGGQSRFKYYVESISK
ncbi:hypothetical protein [uncultured Gemella sp.]|uniref:hypothetical protein n=1 Tax=uncultured Gemella sp. TaxID=254352 RepID=UPI0028D7C496|nr:hypothetical protein [uncultured Gemella sp.]